MVHLFKSYNVFFLKRKAVCYDHIKQVNETLGRCAKSLGLWPSLEKKAFIWVVSIVTCLSLR